MFTISTYENSVFKQDGSSDYLTFTITNNLDIGGTEANPKQVAVNMTNPKTRSYTTIYLQYYVDKNNCYIRPIGGKMS
jgi:hypothetical protein